VVENKRAVANRPQPEKTDLELDCSQPFNYWRKRRGSLKRRRYGDGYIVIAEAPKTTRVGRSGRAALTESRTNIDVSTRERIRELAADGWSLRQIAGQVGVSHESVRQVLAASTVGE
jgi:hypothetical protein